MDTIFLILITAILLMLSYYVFEKDVFSPTFLLCAGYLISFVSTAYNMRAWDVYPGFMTVLIFLTGITAFFVGEYFARYSVGRQSISRTQPALKIIRVNALKYIICVAACVFVLCLTYQEVVRIANLNFADWGNLIYNYKSNSVNSELDDSSLSTLVQQANKVTKGCAYVFLYIFANNLFALKNHRRSEKMKNLLNLVPGALFVAQTMIKGGRFPAIAWIISGVFLCYYFWKKTTGQHSEIPFGTIVKVIAAALAVMFIFWFSREMVGRLTTDTGIVEYITRYLGGGAALFELFLKDSSTVHDAYHETFAGLVTSFNKIGITDILVRSSHEFRSSNGIIIGNAYSAMRNYYHDFGILGVAVMNFLMASIFGSAHYKLKRRAPVGRGNAFRLLLYSSLIYTVFFQFFTDYFFARLSVGYFIEIFIMWLIYYFVLKVKFKFGRICVR